MFSLSNKKLNNKRNRSSNNYNSKKEKVYKKTLIDFNNYLKERKIKFEFLKNSNDKCFISMDNFIYINNTTIKLETIPIDYGATSIIFKATNNINNISYILKIMSISENEIDYMKLSSKYVLNGITPHFVILHQNLLCSNQNDNYKDMIDSTRFLVNNKYSILIMEKFDGNVENLLSNDDYYDDILLSIHAQIYVSILSFHKILKAVHNDVQYKNLYYKKIDFNDNDYIHYIINSKNIYIKNKGYLIVIADYGFSYSDFSSKPNKNPKKQLLEDYDIILDRDLMYNSLNYTNIDNFDNEDKFFDYLIEDTIYFKTDKTLSDNYIILNKKPFII